MSLGPFLLNVTKVPLVDSMRVPIFYSLNRLVDVLGHREIETSKLVSEGLDPLSDINRRLFVHPQPNIWSK
jgi:hypothetical protein